MAIIGSIIRCDECQKPIIKNSPSHKRCGKCKSKPFEGQYRRNAQNKYYARKHGEKCQNCHHRFLSVWSVSDELWKRVTGIKNESGIFCQKCFEKLAKRKNIKIRWRATEYR